MAPVPGPLGLMKLATTTVGAGAVVAALEPTLQGPGIRQAMHVLCDVLFALAESTGGTREEVKQALDRVYDKRVERGHGFGPRPGGPKA